MCFGTEGVVVGRVESSVGEDVFRSVEGLCSELELDRVLEDVLEGARRGILVPSPVMLAMGRRYAALLRVL